MRAVSSSSGAFPTEQVLELWRTSDAVAFDVDSTVCIDEGIDELGVYVARAKGGKNHEGSDGRRASVR